MTQKTLDLDRKEEKLTPQCKSLLDALRKRPMTKLEILNELNIMNSGGRISDLRQSHFDVHTEMIEVNSGKRIARYSISE